MSTSPDNRSIPDLLSDALSQVSELMRDEIELAKAEISNKAMQALSGIAMVGGAAVIAMAALVVLLLCLAACLIAIGLSTPLALFLAAIVGFGIAGVLVYLGLARLKADNLKPKRTVQQLQRDVAAAKEHV